MSYFVGECQRDMLVVYIIRQLVFCSDNGDLAAFVTDPQTQARNSLRMHSQGEIREAFPPLF
jgi:hypothetical protein